MFTSIFVTLTMFNVEIQHHTSIKMTDFVKNHKKICDVPFNRPIFHTLRRKSNILKRLRIVSQSFRCKWLWLFKSSIVLEKVFRWIIITMLTVVCIDVITISMPAIVSVSSNGGNHQHFSCFSVIQSQTATVTRGFFYLIVNHRAKFFCQWSDLVLWASLHVCVFEWACCNLLSRKKKKKIML